LIHLTCMQICTRLLVWFLPVVLFIVGCEKPGLASTAGTSGAGHKIEPIKCVEGLPQTFCDFVSENRGGILPDPRDGKFSEFKVEAIGGWGAPPDKVVGWVFPKEKSGDQYALTANGIRVKVSEVLGGLVLDETNVMSKIINGKTPSFNQESERVDSLGWFRIPVVLIALDRQDLAKVVWTDSEEKNKQFAHMLNQMNISDELLKGFIRDRKLEILECYRTQDWQHGLEVARIYSLNAEKEPANNYYGFQSTPKPEQIVKDLERRLTSKQGPVNLDEISTLETGERRKEIIRALDGNVESKMGQGTGASADWLVQQEGVEMIPLLLEDLKTDDRLAPNANFAFGGFGSSLPVTVRSKIIMMLQQLWQGIPGSKLQMVNSREDFVAVADWYLKEWEVQSNMRLSKRIHRNIVNSQLGVDELNQSIKQLFEKAGPGSMVPYQAGKTPFNIDELTPDEQSQIGDAIEKILSEVTSDAKGNHSSACNLVVGLAKIRGKSCLPILQRYSRDLVTMIDSSSNGSPMNQFGTAMGTVVSQRIALGDRDGAITDMKQMFSKITLEDSSQIWVMRAAWEFPGDKDLQALFESLLKTSQADMLARGNRSVPNFLTSPFSIEVWKSPGVRRFVLNHLKDNSQLGEAKIERITGDSGSYSYTIGGKNAGGSGGPVPRGSKVGSTVSFTVGDFWAHEISTAMSGSEFSLTEPEAQRKAKRNQMIKRIESGNLNLKDVRSGVNNIPVWIP
jgi:hypothetical protein